MSEEEKDKNSKISNLIITRIIPKFLSNHEIISVPF